MAKPTTPVAAPATTEVAAAPAKRPIPSLAHRIKAQLKTQTLKGTISTAELDDLIAYAGKMKEFAAILAAK